MLIQLRTTSSYDGLSNVVRLNRPEQLAIVGSADGDRNAFQVRQLLFDLASTIGVANSTRFLRTLQILNLLLCTTSSGDRVPAREQVVSSIAGLDLDDVTRNTEIVNGGGEDQLHDP